MKEVKVGDLVWNASIGQWDKVIIVEPISSIMSGYKKRMNDRGLDKQVITEAGFAIVIVG